jgi:hypothetical protein
MDLFVTGRDQSAADQPNNLAEAWGYPPLQPSIWIQKHALPIGAMFKL